MKEITTSTGNILSIVPQLEKKKAEELEASIPIIEEEFKGISTIIDKVLESHDASPEDSVFRNCTKSLVAAVVEEEGLVRWNYKVEGFEKLELLGFLELLKNYVINEDDWS